MLSGHQNATTYQNYDDELNADITDFIEFFLVDSVDDLANEVRNGQIWRRTSD